MPLIPYFRQIYLSLTAVKRAASINGVLGYFNVCSSRVPVHPAGKHVSSRPLAALPSALNSYLLSSVASSDWALGESPPQYVPMPHHAEITILDSVKTCYRSIDSISVYADHSGSIKA